MTLHQLFINLKNIQGRSIVQYSHWVLYTYTTSYAN